MKTTSNLITTLFAACAITTAAHADVISHYSFDSDVTTDSVGGNNLTSTGGGVSVTGTAAFGAGAANFNPNDEGNYLWVDSTDFDFGTGEWAISFWYRNVHPNVNSGRIITKSNTNVDAGFNIMITQDSSPDQVVADINDFGVLISADAPANDNTTYHHVVVQRSGDTWEIYLDGALKDTENVVGEDFSSPTSAFAMGARNVSTTGGALSSQGPIFRGDLDEVWVFDTALEQDQINLLISNNMIPEPASLAMLGLGGLMILRRRR